MVWNGKYLHKDNLAQFAQNQLIHDNNIECFKKCIRQNYDFYFSWLQIYQNPWSNSNSLSTYETDRILYDELQVYYKQCNLANPLKLFRSLFHSLSLGA